MTRLVPILVFSCFALISYSEEGDHPTMLRLEVSADSSSRLSARTFLSFAESYFSTASDIGLGRVKIQLDNENLNLEFLDASKSEFPLCGFGIELTKDFLVLDDEKLAMEIFLDRMRNYAETAKLTESTPGVYLRVAPDVSFSRFFEVASAMSSAGVSRIHFSSYENELTEQDSGLNGLQP